MKKLLLLMIICFFTSCASEEDGVSNANLDHSSSSTTTALSSEMQAITIRPASTKIVGLGETEQLTLDVLMKDGSVIEGVTDELTLSESESDTPLIVQWSTQNFGVAVVAPDGVVTSVSSGDTLITAKLGLLEAQSQVMVEAENSLNPNIDTALPPQ